MATEDSKTKIGLPEIMLGILPGFGGTQRMPRLIGLQKSLSIILPGKAVDGKKAFKLGLVDALVPKAWLKDKAESFILGLEGSHGKKKIKKIKQKRKVQGLVNVLLEKTFIGNQIIFSQAKKTIMSQTKGLYPAPLKALEVIQKTQHLTLKQGLAIEAKALGDLAQTGVCKNLIHIYYLNEEAKKATGVLSVEKFDTASIANLTEVAVIGAGVMGGGIAQLFASQNYGVRLKDISWELVAKGFEAAAKILKGSVKRKRLSQRESDLKLGHITGTIDYSGFKPAGEERHNVFNVIVKNVD
jgi:3-hydroxyacyl-CoA dehydrogenase/enoyl-CoA hydratase/3-hydroxybutyryl-CoA epimerase